MEEVDRGECGSLPSEGGSWRGLVADHFPVLDVSQEELPSFQNRIVVAGSRSYSNYQQFDFVLNHILRVKGLDKSNSVILTGKAPRGPDNMVIEWCESHGWKYCGFPADWDQYGKSAGYRRNIQMKEVATHVIVFWDARSKGSEHMLKISGADKNIQVILVVVEADYDY